MFGSAKYDEPDGEAKKEIDAQQEKAMTEIKREAGSIAVAVAEKVLGEEINEEKHARLIQETIA